VTLGRLALAWAPVALWFVAVSWLTEGRPAPGQVARRVFRCGGEALLLTLLASLWFDSLGHGGWWILFALVGLIAGVPARQTVWLVAADAARYVAAGAILAWRLG
jgi:hypothetical protein